MYLIEQMYSFVCIRRTGSKIRRIQIALLNCILNGDRCAHERINHAMRSLLRMR